MKTKYDQFDVATTIDTIRSFDIYKITRKYKKLFNLSSMKQVDVEDLTGFARCSFISGGKLIEAYKSYLKYPSKTLLSDMLTHNHDDIRGLISISEFANMPYITSEAKIRDVIINTDSLTYICNVKKLPCRITYSDKNNNRIVLNAHDTELRLTVSRTNDTLKYYFKDYKNYFYLPLEDMAIHKSKTPPMSKKERYIFRLPPNAVTKCSSRATGVVKDSLRRQRLCLLYVTHQMRI